MPEEEVPTLQMSAPHAWCRESTRQTWPHLWVTMTKTPISSVRFMIRPPITVWTSLKTQACPKQPITQCQNSREGSCMEFLQAKLYSWSTQPWVTYDTDLWTANTLSLHTYAHSVPTWNNSNGLYATRFVLWESSNQGNSLYIAGPWYHRIEEIGGKMHLSFICLTSDYWRGTGWDITVVYVLGNGRTNWKGVSLSYSQPALNKEASYRSRWNKTLHTAIQGWAWHVHRIFLLLLKQLHGRTFKILTWPTILSV